MKEIWVPAIYIFQDGTKIDFTGLYEVSNLHNVNSLSKIDLRGNRRKEKPLKFNFVRGYHYVTLYKDGIPYKLKLYRLMMSSFCPNSNTYECVNHKDENKLNDFIYINEDGTVDLEKSNLEWCTQQDNVNWGTAPKRRTDTYISKGYCTKPVFQFDLKGNFLKEWSSLTEIFNCLGYSIQAISACCRGKSKSSYGYIWRFKEECEIKKAV